VTRWVFVSGPAGFGEGGPREDYPRGYPEGMPSGEGSLSRMVIAGPAVSGLKSWEFAGGCGRCPERGGGHGGGGVG
jgi:hypothetical protein